MKQPIKTIQQRLAERGGANTQPKPAAQNRAPAQQAQGAQGMQSQPGDETFNGIVEELAQLIQRGELPEGVDIETLCADNAFIELAMEYPVDAAVRIYEAEKRAEQAEQAAMERVNAQVRNRSALPKSARGGAMASPKVNYRDMDSETFRKFHTDLRKNARSGIRTTL